MKKIIQFVVISAAHTVMDSAVQTFRSTFTAFLLLLVAVTVPAVSRADSTLKPHTFHSTPPPLVLLDMAGKRHSLEEYQGKVVVINFFGTWCPPCLQEMPSLLLLTEALKDQPFAVLAVDVGDSPARLRQVFGEQKDAFTILLDSRGRLHAAGVHWHSRPVLCWTLSNISATASKDRWSGMTPRLRSRSSGCCRMHFHRRRTATREAGNKEGE